MTTSAGVATNASVDMASATATSRHAESQLGAHLLSDDELDGLIEDCLSADYLKRRDGGRVVKTGVGSLDRAFGGGLEEGRVVGVWGDGGSGAICRALLADSLLKYEGSTAAVVDTTGNFDVLALYKVLLAKLQDSPDTLASLRSAIANAGVEFSVEDVTAKVLDRVKIMRVFDFVGIKEAVDEVRDGLEGRRAVVRELKRQDESKWTVGEEEKKITKQPSKRTVVADSEDEAEEDDEEMLFDTSDAPVTEDHTTTSTSAPNSQQHQTTTTPHTPSTNLNSPTLLKFLLIDNLNQVLTPLLKANSTSTYAVTTPFLTTLTNLTRTHALHTILLNPTTTPRPPSPRRDQGPLPPQNRQQLPPPPQSVFASRNEVPSLLALLGGRMDIQVLVGKVPRGRRDAGVWYRESGEVAGVAGRGKKGVRMVGVVEIMGDRLEGRVGAWGTFLEGEGGIRDV